MRGSVWGPFADSLSASMRVISVDLRGHGQSSSVPGPYTFDSMAEDILHLMDRLQIKHITLVGWSMGTVILLKLLTLDAMRVDSLVCISGTPSLVNRDSYTCGVGSVVVNRLLRRLERSYPEGLRNFYAMLLTPGELAAFCSDPVYLHATDLTGAPARHVALESLVCLRDSDVRTNLSTVSVPTLLVHGTSDVVCPPEAARYMHAAIPGANMVLLEETGHMPFLTKKDATCKAITAFLRQV